MKFDFTKNKKAKYKIKVCYFCQINADELYYSNKQDVVKKWVNLMQNPKDIQSAFLINLMEEYVERVFERTWN